MSKDPRVQASATERLLEMRDNAAGDLKKIALSSDDPELRRQAIYFLSQTAPNNCSDVLRAGLQDAAPPVRAAAATACARTGAEELLPELRKTLLADPNEAVRREALYTLLDLGEYRAEEKPLAQFLLSDLAHDKVSVRAKAIDLLADLGSQTAAEPIEKILAGDASAWARARAAAALEKLRSRRSVPTLITALDDEAPQVAGAAKSALEVISGKKHGPDPDPWRAWWEKSGGAGN